MTNGEKFNGKKSKWLSVQGLRFLPLLKIWGIIIIDEEHETTYKQEEAPRYHARDVAVERGNHHRCPVVLGSATPTLESFARAKKGVYHFAELDKGEQTPLPPVEIIDMREELHAGNRSDIFKGFCWRQERTTGKRRADRAFLKQTGIFFVCHVPRLRLCRRLPPLRHFVDLPSI